MAYADFNFYQSEFKGQTIPSEEAYATPAERASDELARFLGRIPADDTAQTLLKRCACRIADIAFETYKGSKCGAPITSESVNGYYSVSYGVATGAEAEKAYRAKVNSAIALYLGRYLQHAAKVRI